MSAAKLVEERTPYVLCRTFGHAWLTVTYDRKGQTITISCARCGTVRSDHVNGRNGERGSASYQYPPGYLTTKGQPRRFRTEYRLEVIRRAVKGAL